jgi:hypothetical protein
MGNIQKYSKPARLSSTVLEHLIYVEGHSFLDALRLCRQSMLSLQREQGCAQSLAQGLTFGSGLGGLAVFATGAIAPAALCLAGAGFLFWQSRELMKAENDLTLQGEAAMWERADALSWLTRLWQSGIPEGQIISGYNAYAERLTLGHRGEREPGVLSEKELTRAIAGVVDLYSIPLDPPKPGVLPIPEPEVEDETISEDPWVESSPKVDVEAVRALFEVQVQAELGQEAAVAVAEINAWTALDRMLSNPFKSRAWFGGERCGKSYGASKVSQTIGARIYHINLASYGDEDEQYWGHAVQSVRTDLDMIERRDAQVVLGEALALLERFKQDTEPSILIFDEWALSATKTHRYAEFLAPLTNEAAGLMTTLSSSGTKRQKAIWAISPKLVSGELSQSGKAVKGLELTYVAIGEGQSIEWNGKHFRLDNQLHDQLCANFRDIPKPGYSHGNPRQCWVGDEWLPLGW